jgi:ABC-type nitrate/sulfonate/bicarbonate transport system permease component
MNLRNSSRRKFRWRELYLEHRTRARAVASVIGGFLLWEILARTVLTNRLIIVPFSTVLSTIWALAGTGELWKNVYASLTEFLLGFSLAAVAGVFLGFLTGTSVRAREYLEPLVAALYATPLVALIPFYILIFGIQLASKVALVFTIAVFPSSLTHKRGFFRLSAACSKSPLRFAPARGRFFLRSRSRRRFHLSSAGFGSASAARLPAWLWLNSFLPPPASVL